MTKFKSKREAIRAAFNQIGGDTSTADPMPDGRPGPLAVNDVLKLVRSWGVKITRQNIYDVRRYDAATNAKSSPHTLHNSKLKTAKEIKVPQRFDLNQIRSLLGDAEADRIVAAFLRKRAAGIVKVTTSDLQLARELTEATISEQPYDGYRQAYPAFCRVSRKYLLESKTSAKRFLTFIKKLEEIANLF